MPTVRFIRSVIWKGEGVHPGTTVEATEQEAYALCEGYKDAVRIDGSEAPKPTGMTTKDVIVDRQVVASHRDPVRKK
jgi:hypothetical protein